MPLERVTTPLELSEAQAGERCSCCSVCRGWGAGRCGGGVLTLGQLSETAGQPPVASDASQGT